MVKNPFLLAFAAAPPVGVIVGVVGLVGVTAYALYKINQLNQQNSTTRLPPNYFPNPQGFPNDPPIRLPNNTGHGSPTKFWN